MRFRRHGSAGNGDHLEEFAELRQRMVERHLRARGIDDPAILTAFLEVPREEFVPAELRDEAYNDSPLPIGHGQTISQPFTVAFMAQAAKLRSHDRVLEIGTGSGYGAAILSRLCQIVHTVERIPELADSARDRLHRLGFDRVIVHTSDGTLGLVGESPFDAIVITAGGRELPQPYREQLSDGGRIVVPLGSAPNSQRMKRFTRCGDQYQEEDLGHFAFVPLIGELGWHELPE